MRNADKVRKNQLGMTFGKANGILFKKIMFCLAQKAGKDICHCCNEKITNIDEFTIEHKENWQYSKDPPKLYFDINNIAFSHAKCNRPKRLKIVKSKFGFKGVSINKKIKNNKYNAVISLNGKSVHIGVFKTAEEAALAYDKKIIDIEGPNAVTNRSLGLIKNE